VRAHRPSPCALCIPTRAGSATVEMGQNATCASPRGLVSSTPNCRAFRRARRRSQKCQVLTHAPHKKAEAKGGNSYGHCLSGEDLRAIQLPQLPANCSPPTSATRSGICGVRELRIRQKNGGSLLALRWRRRRGRGAENRHVDMTDTRRWFTAHSKDEGCGSQCYAEQDFHNC
jgi:hypothetical protein